MSASGALDSMDRNKKGADISESVWIATRNQSIYNSVKCISDFLLLKEKEKVKPLQPGEIAKKILEKTKSVGALFGRWKSLKYILPTCDELVQLQAQDPVLISSIVNNEENSKKRKIN